MARQKRHNKPEVLLTTVSPDGSHVSERVTWDEAHGQQPRGFQLLAEYSHIHNAILPKESDRAVAILAPAFLDVACEALLRHFMMESPATDELLESDRALGTFSSRINAASAFGLLAEDVIHDLRLIRRVRNEFAHEVAVHSFDEPSVADRCRSLRMRERWGAHADIGTPRERFILAAWAVMTEIGKSLAVPRASHLKRRSE